MLDWRDSAPGTIVLPMGLRSVRRQPAHATPSETLALLLFALLILAAAVAADVPTNDPRLSIIYTFDDEGLPVERPQPERDSVLHAVAAAGPDVATASGAVESPAPPPAVRLVEAAPRGGPATRAPPQS